MNPLSHLIVAPIVLPLVGGALLLFAGERRRKTSLAIAFVAAGLTLIASLLLAGWVDMTGAQAYRLGDWPSHVGIVLVADRLSALMTSLSGILVIASLAFSIARWRSAGPHFLPLLMFLLMGLNGAFLTGDLFNLFVFFEVLLAASYGLILHGSGQERVKASLHYVAVNLVASLLFLIGASLIFGVTGTLNIALLAERIPHAPEDTRSLLHAGAALLGVTFLIKAAAWPLGMWLPRAYVAASPPVAAVFAVMTKVGVYALMRLSFVVFGDDAGPSMRFGAEIVGAAGVLTITVGMIGALSSRSLSRIGAYSVLVSSGALMIAIGLGDAEVTGGALFYLAVSTVSLAALFLLAGLAEPRAVAQATDDDVADVERYDPFDDTFTEEDEQRVLIPRPLAVLSGSFLACTLLVAGMPPLAGFLAKLAFLSPMLGPGAADHGLAAIIGFSLILVSGLAMLIALLKTGIRLFWAETEETAWRIRASELAPMAGLVLIGVFLTLFPEPLVRYAAAAGQNLHDGRAYISAVLGPVTATEGAP